MLAHHKNIGGGMSGKKNDKKAPKLIDLELMQQELKLRKLHPILIGLELAEGTEMALSIVPGKSGHPLELEINGPDLQVITFEFDECIDYSILPSIPIDSRIILAAASEDVPGYLDHYVANIASVMAACLGELKVEFIEPTNSDSISEVDIVHFTFTIGEKEFFTTATVHEVEHLMNFLPKAA